MNRRICSRSSSEAGSETAGRMHRCRFCSKLCGVAQVVLYTSICLVYRTTWVAPACQQTHTVLSCTAGRPPVDWSLCHHDYRMCIPQPATRALSFDTPQLLSPLCLHRGIHTYMHAHPQQGRRAARCCLGLLYSHHSHCCCGRLFFLI